MKEKQQKDLLKAALARNPENEQVREALKALMGHKYSAKRCEIDGIKFASKKEARYYQDLRLRERAKEIAGFELQPEFILQEAFIKDGKKYGPIKYRADFLIKYPNGDQEVIDVKGMETQVFKLKRKMFEKRYPDLTIIIV